jgi:L-cystine transport system substrate-binding protein
MEEISMNKLYTFMSVMALIFVLAACGTNGEQQEGTQENNGEGKQASLYDQIKEEGKLNVGTEGTYPPFTFHDESGKLTGFDVDIAKEVAKRLDLEAEFFETQWDAMFAGLDAKRFDMIANQVGIRPDRQEKYDFSDPYITSSAVLVAHKDNSEVKSFEDMEGLKSAQSLTSNYAKIAESHGAELVSVPGFNEAIQLITSKRADVTVNDRLSVLDYLNTKKDAPIKIVARQSEAAQSGLMFRKGSTELVNAVNKALQEMKDDGTYLEISKKWFGEDVSK